MEITESKPLIERKLFIIRALENHNMTQEEFDAEYPELDRQIKENLAKALVEQENSFKEAIIETKSHTIYDGDLKRQIATILYNMLQDSLTNDEIKGVFRTGYKISRGR
jgi:hypothetical protein